MIIRPEPDPIQPQPEGTSNLDLLQLDRRLTSALETAPTPSVPHNFAQRVLNQLPQPAQRLPETINLPTVSVGRRVLLAALLLLLAGMFAIASPAQSSPVFRSIEWSLDAEFILLTVWLAFRPQFLR